MVHLGGRTSEVEDETDICSILRANWGFVFWLTASANGKKTRQGFLIWLLRKPLQDKDRDNKDSNICL